MKMPFVTKTHGHSPQGCSPLPRCQNENFRFACAANSQGRKGLAFTLVELVVVAGIIAILVALLFPVSMAAVHSGRQATCSANLRQITAELQSYASDNNGITMPSYSGNSSWGMLLAQWDGSISNLKSGKTGGSFGIWRCPENLQQTFDSTNSSYHGLGAGEFTCSYMMNGFGEGGTNAPGKDNQYGFNYLGNLTHPSQLYMVWDGLYARADVSLNSGAGSVPTNMYSTGLSDVRYAHTGKVNMVFADGHGAVIEGPLIGEGTRLIAGATPAINTFSNGIHWFAK